MNVPRPLREQAKQYEAKGFHIVSVEPSRGSHYKVKFAEFTEPQFLSINVSDPRAIRNNISRFRALAEGKK